MSAQQKSARTRKVNQVMTAVAEADEAIRQRDELAAAVRHYLKVRSDCTSDDAEMLAAWDLRAALVKLDSAVSAQVSP